MRSEEEVEEWERDFYSVPAAAVAAAASQNTERQNIEPAAHRDTPFSSTHIQRKPKTEKRGFFNSLFDGTKFLQLALTLSFTSS